MIYGVPDLGGLELSSSALLIAVGRQARDHGEKLLQHLRPAELGAPKCLFAPRLGDIKAGMLEEDASAITFRLEPEAHPRIDDWSTGRPREFEPTARFALDHLALDE